MSADIDSGEEAERSLEFLTRNLSRHTQRPPSVHSLGGTCCCGSSECESMRRSQSILHELEGQMRIAGSLGQALLKRHESSMAEAESRQASTTTIILELEMRTKELEDENARTEEENKRILDTLDELNISMALSESWVKELQEDLDAAHAELSRISAHAARTAVLETQLEVLESEQEELRNTIVTTKEEEKAATLRWKRAERQLADLEHQLERIDREHTLEKARSKNILERMEQRKFANQKAGTFPPALADKSALSRFMKEILAENGHLQLGAAELRDMLTQSQEEVNMLRHKLEGMESAEYGVPIDMEIPLNMELARTPTQPSGVVGGVVVHHHHYHSPNNAAKEKSAMKPQIRQPRKKKNVTINHFNTIQVRGFTVENSGSKRWSSSTGPPSSSPTSTFHESSIFDRVEAGNDTSRPTSADSNYPPPWPKWSKHHRSASSNPPPFTILHTTEEVPSEPGSPVHPPPEISMSPSYQSLQLPTLKRAISHESILSVSALDTTVFLAAHSATSSFVSRRPGGGRLRRGGTIKANDPQASITHGTAIRDNGGSQWSGDAYSRLLGLHQAEGTSPPTNGRPPLTKKSTSSSSSNSNNNAASRLWKYVTLAPGFKQVKAEEPTHAKIKKMFTKPVVGLVDEDLLREALGDGPGLFVGGSGLL